MRVIERVLAPMRDGRELVADLHQGTHNPFFQDMILKPFGDEH